MTAYRFYNPAPVMMDLLGLQPCAGGSLTFYDKGTTTPKMTWSDEGLTIPNTNPVVLDSSGRSNTNIWLDGPYSVVLKTADGVTVFTRDVNDGAGDGLTIPTPLQSGKFLSNDGANLLWDLIRQVPDPSGSGGKILSTDGNNLIWVAEQSIPASTATSGDGYLRIGDYAVRWGRAQCPASGGVATSTTVTIPTTPFQFTETPFVFATVNSFPFYTPSYGGMGIIMARPASLNSIEVQMHANIQPNADTKVIAPQDFTWVAFGKVA